MNFDVNKLKDLFKKEDTAQYKDNAGNTKKIEDTSLFELEDNNYSFNDSLKTEENFIESLFVSSGDGISEEQLKTIYDSISSLDNKEGMSEEELKFLASLGNEKDKIDTQGNIINELDIAAFLEAVDDAIADPAYNENENDTTNEQPVQEPAIFKDDDRIKEEKVVTEKAVDVSELPDGWSQNGKGEILDVNGKVIGKVKTTEMDGTNDGVSDTVESFFLYEETAQKYVEVEPWSNKNKDNNNKNVINDNYFVLYVVY